MQRIEKFNDGKVLPTSETKQISQWLLQSLIFCVFPKFSLFLVIDSVMGNTAVSSKVRITDLWHRSSAAEFLLHFPLCHTKLTTISWYQFQLPTSLGWFLSFIFFMIMYLIHYKAHLSYELYKRLETHFSSSWIHPSIHPSIEINIERLPCARHCVWLWRKKNVKKKQTQTQNENHSIVIKTDFVKKLIFNQKIVLLIMVRLWTRETLGNI